MSKEQMQEEQQEEQQPPTIDPKEYESLKEQLVILKKNNSDLLDEKMAARKLAEVAKEAAEVAKLEAARASGDIEQFKKSIEETQIKPLQQMLDDLKRENEAITVGSVVKDLAVKLFGDKCDKIAHGIEKRIRRDKTDTGYVYRVLDKDGSVTAKSVDDLANEYRNSNEWAEFVIGSRASGGAAHGTGKGVGAQTMTRSSFDALSPKQRAEFARGGGRLIDG